jgi:L-fuconolactonase
VTGIVDAHHHLWRLARGDYGWLTPDLGILHRDYGPADIEALAAAHGIAATILVQAAPTEAETRYLLDLAKTSPLIAGVVGWLDFEAADFADRLADLATAGPLVGLRPMLQGLDDDAYVLRPAVLSNLDRLAAAGLAFDVLTFPRHLPHVLAALAPRPGLRAVVDHLSKPPIAAGTLDPWRADVAAVAALPNVMCKVSGLVTEADHASWTPADLEPFVAHVVRAFGPDRLMWGSDWPVCLLTAPYGRVLDVTRELLSRHLAAEDLEKVFATNARRFYGV